MKKELPPNQILHLVYSVHYQTFLIEEYRNIMGTFGTPNFHFDIDSLHLLKFRKLPPSGSSIQNFHINVLI